MNSFNNCTLAKTTHLYFSRITEQQLSQSVTKPLFMAQFYCKVIDHGFRKLKESARPLHSLWPHPWDFSPHSYFIFQSTIIHHSWTENSSNQLYNATIKKKVNCLFLVDWRNNFREIAFPAAGSGWKCNRWNLLLYLGDWDKCFFSVGQKF